MNGEVYRGVMVSVPDDGQMHHVVVVLRDGRVVVFMDGEKSPPSLPNP